VPDHEDNGYERAPRLKRDLARAARSMTDEQARYLVDSYYTLQEHRIALAAQLRHAEDTGEREAAEAVEGESPIELIRFMFEDAKREEDNIRLALDEFSNGRAVGVWAKTIMGIGPVLSAGLLAHIDIEKAPTAGSIWRFAGLDPTAVWGKGEKRPHNARLKVLCWKIGESFIKVSNRDGDYYGHVYATRRAEEEARNEAGDYAAIAADALATRKIGKNPTRDAYEAGRLPDGRIHLRASRYATKLFLAHWHDVAYRDHYGMKPPKPYIIEHGGHVHFIEAPNMPEELRGLPDFNGGGPKGGGS
jgi:hypothetical protein